MTAGKINITHIITGLDVGGAEIMLCRLLEHSCKSSFHHQVISLSGRGELAQRIENSGASLECIYLNRPLTFLPSLVHLVRLLAKSNTDIAQTWLTHANFFGSIASWLAGIRSVVWTLHTGNQDPSRVKWNIRAFTRILAALSHWMPTTIVSCSETAKKRHHDLGFRTQKMLVIPNGTDTQTFRPFAPEAERLFQNLGIPPDAPVVGIAGRWTPEKDYDTFFKAALCLQQRIANAHFVICGGGLDASNPNAASYLQNSPFPSHFHLLGLRDDMPVVLSGMRIFALTSVSEAFPLVLGEAMACGVPCVSTRVGDCEHILGDSGRFTPTGNAEAIAKSWEEMLNLSQEEYQRLSHSARNRIEMHFSIQKCVTSYERLFRKLCAAIEEPKPSNVSELSPSK